jgi:hypothetical protein
VTGSTNRAPKVRILVRGEISVAFKTALQDDKKEEEGETVQISLDYINKSLDAVTYFLFLYHSLETQSLCMNKKRKEYMSVNIIIS